MRTITSLVVAMLAAASFSMPLEPVEAFGTVDPAEASWTVEPAARLVRDIAASGGSEPSELTRAGDLVYFSADDGIHGRELWATDGTEDGTRLVRDIRPGAKGSSPIKLTRVGAAVYFTAGDGTHGRELWVSDGTTAGTKLVKDLVQGLRGSRITGIADAGGTAYVGVAGRELWRTDGSPTGTALIRTYDSVRVEAAKALGSQLYFPADDAMWRTNGTRAGTKRLSPAYWYLGDLTPFRRRIYYRAEPLLAPFGGPSELWATDGTKAGTVRIGGMQDVSHLTTLGQRLYFNARPGPTKASRLYVGDGTAGGTVASTPRVRSLRNMVAASGRLWTNDASRQPLYEPDELWVSDGTATGTHLVYGGTEDWFVSSWDGLDCVGFDGRLIFVAGPGGPVDDEKWTLSDHELWTSDGTTAGTLQAADVNPTASSFPRDLTRLGRTVLFSADDGTHGRELWIYAPPVGADAVGPPEPPMS